MSKKALSISLVIPVYNEESHLAACLRSALTQTIPFAEIIVVDNNSTDATATIAHTFSNVKVISESRQGVVYARNRGFDSVTSDIIARIDADTRLPISWSQTVLDIFHESKADAISGRMHYYDLPFSKFFDAVDVSFRRYFAWCMGAEIALQGSNMAIRRTSWEATRSQVCMRAGIHEDFDLAIHANMSGQRVRFDGRLVAAVGYRQANSRFWPYCRYLFTGPATYRQHGLKRSARYMYPYVWLNILNYVPIKLLHHGFDEKSGKFSWRKLVHGDQRKVRVNPATFVD